MRAIGIIPARYGSTRLPAKMLKRVCGKTLIEWTYLNALQATRLSEVIIATDHIDIATEARLFGAPYELTREDHPSGTDRIAEVAANLDCDIVVNIQGDEPLICASAIDDLVLSCTAPDVQMATLAHPISESEAQNPNCVKVIFTPQNNAIYFSRSVIPYNRHAGNDVSYHKHIGIYAYKRDFLLKFVQLGPSYLEYTESLEQLRALEHDYPIKVVITHASTVSVDTEQDLKHLEQVLHRIHHD